MKDTTIKLMNNIILLNNRIEVLERDVNQSIEKLKANEQDLADASIKLKESIKELTMNLNGMQ
jgi:outer membrane murein-binding lipoprotein Lpp